MQTDHCSQLSKKEYKKPDIVYVKGFPIPGKVFTQENFQSAINYKARPDDIFLVAYPKCGITWLQCIVWEIFNKGAPLPSFWEMMMEHTPFMERTGAEVVENMNPPRIIKVHLPYHLIPKHPLAKYIFLARNPFDCCVSFYHHTKNFSDTYNFSDGTFNDYFECFIRGEIQCGNYLDYLLSWWPHRHDANVLFITFEEMKSNTEAILFKIANFLGIQFYTMLETDPKLVKKILEITDFHNMKGKMDLTFYRNFKQNKNVKVVKNVNFFREGKVGNWKSYFTKEQIQRLVDHINEKTKDLNFPQSYTRVMCTSRP
ncbi:sulfotransferase ssu-1-like [Tachypleus tridentatus]|uniref:sulfotransferase ssu-1-like n=1 Tax=Tachypleus tridentatus TaxID=6853 RepID=UPI003FD1C903